MARIQKRKKKDGSFTYTVTIRKGKLKHNPEIRTFSKRNIAESWARNIEAEIERGTYTGSRSSRSYKVTDLITRYVEEILPHKSSGTQEISKIRFEKLLDDCQDYTLDRFDNEIMYGIFTSMLDRVTKQTEHKPANLQKKWSRGYVVKFIQDMTNVFRVAGSLWNVPLPYGNVAANARKLMKENYLLVGSDLHKDTRLVNDQYSRLRNFKANGTVFKHFALFAIETGMRRSEIIGMKRSNIDWKQRIYTLEEHKSDAKRTRHKKGREVPLTYRAIALLRLVIWSQKNDQLEVWPWRGKYAGSTAYRGVKRIFKNLGMHHMTIHDLRHEFGSYHIDRGMDMRLIGAAMGHQSLNSTKRYTHPDAKKVVVLFDEKRS